MYITNEVYKNLVQTGVAFVGKTKDLYLEHRGTLKPSFLQVVEDYKLDLHIKFGNVFVVAKKKSLVYGYRI